MSTALLDQPLAHAEFLVVDTETNGLAGDACELTEVGAVLVGGGELHDRWETLVAGVAPLSRAMSRRLRWRRSHELSSASSYSRPSKSRRSSR